MLNLPEARKTRILVVEDSYLTAQAVCDMVVEHGYQPIGPVGHIDSGIRFVCENAVDAAVVDIDLHGTSSFPICEQLAKRDIPFVFLTGYNQHYPMPAEFRAAPWLQKPLDGREFRIALAGLAQSAAVPGAGRDNQILDRLPAGDRQALQAEAEHVPMVAGDVLATAGGAISHVYFPTAGVVSMTARAHGKGIEIALVGRDGALGLEVALGKARSAATDMVVHAAGSTWRLPADAMEALIEERPALRTELLGAVHAYLAEIAETAVSTANDTIEQRLARRLIMVSLRLGARHLALTHDALARLMAVRRSGVTVALHMLEGRHVIRARRGIVEILDYEGLSRVADGRVDGADVNCAGSVPFPSS
jgi:CRP-like cAMP-binding protein